jgi:hypothetical protein
MSSITTTGQTYNENCYKLLDISKGCAIALIALVAAAATEAWAIYQYQITKDDCGAPPFTNYSSVACENMNSAVVSMIGAAALAGAVVAVGCCLGACSLARRCKRAESFQTLA